jgi:hypothetical protein
MARLYSSVPAIGEGNTSHGLDSFFYQARPEPQVLTIDPAYDQVITGRKGLRLHIPARSLRMQNGAPATDTVLITIHELSDPREALLAGLSTNAGSRILQHIGLFSIFFGHPGQPLQLIHPIQIELPVSTSRLNGTIPGIYQAGVPAIRTGTAQGSIEWRSSPRPLPHIKKNGGQRLLQSTIVSGGVYGCGFFAPVRQSNVMLSVKAFGSYEHLAEARAYLILDKYQANVQLHRRSTTNFSGFNLPNQATGWLLVIGWNKEEYVFGLRRMSPLQNRVEQIELKPIQPKHLQHAIRNMLC